MIDNFAIGITHLLMMVAAFRLLGNPRLDREPTIHEGAGDA